MKTVLLPAGPLDSDRVVAFDFETTGLDPRRDEIIEAGVVRLESGKIQHVFSQLYAPTIPIPELITQITGITDQDCQDKPALRMGMDALLPQFDATWLVAHNANFDREFLRAACKNWGYAYRGIDDKLVDTLELSRFLLPWLPNHRLDTIAGHFNVETGQSHRAADDAQAAGVIFFHLTHLACQLDKQILVRAMQLTEGAKDGLHSYFERIHVYRLANEPSMTLTPQNLPVAILGDLNGIEKGPKVHTDDPASFLLPDGYFAQQWPDYEFRAPQLEMAKAVNTAFKQDTFLVAEAGTGVGKTVAYLLPALSWAMREKQRFIVATHTKTLQDQIFSKDLPGLSQVLGGGFLAVLLKGRQNYLCYRQLYLSIHHGQIRLQPRQRRALLPLLLWAEQTRTGDIEENGGFSRERNMDIWGLIHSDSRSCIGPVCEHYTLCHYQKVRKTAKMAHMVLVNHALLFADVMTGHGVLGEYASLIVDESHQLERAATESLAVVLNDWVFKDFIDKIKGKDSRHPGLAAFIFQWIQNKKLEAPHRFDYERQLEALSQHADALNDVRSAFFTAMARHPALTGLSGFDKYRIRDRLQFFTVLTEEISSLENILNLLYDVLTDLSSWLDRDADLADPDGLDYARHMEGLVLDVQSLRQRLSMIVHGEGEDDICWAEPSKNPGETQITLKTVPLDIARLLADQLYPGVDRCVMTSATLSIGGRFDYALSRLGLHFMETDRLTTRLFGSPFEYDSQVRFFIPTFMPSPKSPEYVVAVSDLLCRVFEQVHRGTMVLFTSYKMLQEVYAAVKPALSAKGVTLMGQSIDGSRSQLLRRFREEHSSVLFGTASFWEGVDVPGQALELLILTKIPFDVPSDPVVEARTEAVQERTGSGFMNFAVPEAIVKVRQGFGRLIRSGQDHGAVLMLDPRMIQTQYGRFFLQALPVEAQKCQTEAQLLEGLANWFEKK